jgi:hypothetical protein
MFLDYINIMLTIFHVNPMLRIEGEVYGQRKERR